MFEQTTLHIEDCPLNGKLEACDEGMRLTLILPAGYVEKILASPTRFLKITHAELVTLLQQATEAN